MYSKLIEVPKQRLNIQESRYIVQNCLRLVTIVIISPNVSQHMKGPKGLRLKNLIFKFIGNLVSRHDRENPYRGINIFEEVSNLQLSCQKKQTVTTLQILQLNS
jgi:hypothetical protein